MVGGQKGKAWQPAGVDSKQINPSTTLRNLIFHYHITLIGDFRPLTPSGRSSQVLTLQHCSGYASLSFVLHLDELFAEALVEVPRFLGIR